MTAKCHEVKDGLRGEGCRRPAGRNRPQRPGRENPLVFRSVGMSVGMSVGIVLPQVATLFDPNQPPGPIGQIGAPRPQPKGRETARHRAIGWPRSLFDVGNRLGAGDDAGDVGVFPLRHRAIGLLLVPDFPPLGFFALPYFARQFLPSLLEWIDTRSHYSGAV